MESANVVSVNVTKCDIESMDEFRLLVLGYLLPCIGRDCSHRFVYRIISQYRSVRRAGKCDRHLRVRFLHLLRMRFFIGE